MVINIFAICLAVTFALLYKKSEYAQKEPDFKGKKDIYILYKGATTLSISLIALFAKTPYSILIFIGLFVCALSDMLLEKSFLYGMGLFGIGHIFYMLAYINNNSPSPLLLIPYLLFAAFCYILSHIAKDKLKELRLPVFLYGLLLFASFTLALSKNILTAFGALLFLISDMIILYRITVKQSKFNDYVCLSLYYIGQLLIALSTLA